MRNPSMDSLLKCCFSLLALIITTVIKVRGQEADFISIDCGYSGSNYLDSGTNLTFTSDDNFIDSGIKSEISSRYKISSLSKQSSTVRSFPNGSRNCYTLPAKKSGKYLLRAGFMYGDYDNGLSMTNNKNGFRFGLHIGIDSWANVSVEMPSVMYMFEAITVVPAEFISVCLVNMNFGTPFISSLEMRPFDSTLYPSVSSDQTLALSFRYNMGPQLDGIVRYPDDSYDRIWRAYSNYSTVKLKERRGNDSVTYLTNDSFLVPQSVLLTAIEPITPYASVPISLEWFPDKYLENPKYYLILHFCELYKNDSATRKINVFVNGVQSYMSSKNIIASYLIAGYVYSITPISGQPSYNFELYASSDSSYVPLLNAVEVYYTIAMSSVATLPSDAMTMKGIKRSYDLTMASWQGDPCAPIGYTWLRVGCTSLNGTLRITSIDLSSSKLTGTISNNFANLSELVFLDLSSNSLSGPIPDFLGSLVSLKVLNLSGNCFTGSIPNNLLSKNGLVLRYEGYNACKKIGSSSKSNHTLIIVISCVVVAVLLAGILAFFIWRKLRNPQESTPFRGVSMAFQGVSMTPLFSPTVKEKKIKEDELKLSGVRKFSYKELEKMTNNFARFIGKGGFGSVFHGYLADKKEIAVKMQTSSSDEGMKQFLAEVAFLAKIHYRYLVQLVGYCMEGNHLGLVYEYMSQGCITDHLRGPGVQRILSWRERLQIAVDSAQGLDYLHTGCDAPIVHRDVKCSNILLDHNFRAKIADFGLSKAFEDNSQTHMSTMPAGTLGYMDIEYYKTGRLTEKSDVYSFGVVLLELVTGEPPVDIDTGHITNRVNAMVMKGEIDNMIDKKLARNYEINSIWKVVDIAIHCTADLAQHRPTMGEVVAQLKESLALETARESNTYNDVSIASTSNGNDSFLYRTNAVVSEAFGPAAR